MTRLLLFPHPLLKKPSAPVDDFGSELQELVGDLQETMLAHNGAGISAIQIGVPKQVFIVAPDVVLVNPTILLFSSAQSLKTEGCLSFPGIFEKVLRSERVAVKYQGVDGISQTDWFEGLQAHAVQHEAEHLDGHTLSDRMTRARRGQVMGELRKRRR